jgi:starch synthase (maltosyl-transferring)
VRLRPVIEHVRPQVDGGTFPAKVAVGDDVVVEADVFADGHDLVACEVRTARTDAGGGVVPMVPLGNDRWRASFPVAAVGPARFAVAAWIDETGTWIRDVGVKVEAGRDVSVDLAVGSALLGGAAERARGAGRRLLQNVAGRLAALSGIPGESSAREALELVVDPHLADAVRAAVPEDAVVRSPWLPLQCDPAHARFSTWYELFPRSASPDPGRPGTLADVVDRLDYVAGLGADVLYLPPIHPIGRTNRKGRGGAPVAAPDDPGSPWAIGAAEGGHLAVHPELGTVADVDRLVAAAAHRGIRIALDLAFQCSPDHPWVEEHPTWFRALPDGSVAYAENPPKRYEDIYPLDFATEDWMALWLALADVVRFWIDHGVTVFRVDNPHTKPLGFWQWLLGTVRAERPDVVFLSEAFTRPRLLERLAKVGFHQSYTYFTWRTTRDELTEYVTELLHTDRADYLRPNFWPTTPDILPRQLQQGSGATFVARLVLAATLAASYGLYGPAFELKVHEPAGPGSEEYAHSEKYEIRHWDLDRPDSLAGLVSRVNAIRREHPALQRNTGLCFHDVDNEHLIAYSKAWGTAAPLPPDARAGMPTAAGPAPVPDVVLVVVNLDPTYVQSGWVTLRLEALGLAGDHTFEVHDLLTDARYRWWGPRNFVRLDPGEIPAHIFHVRPVDGAFTPVDPR